MTAPSSTLKASDLALQDHPTLVGLLQAEETRIGVSMKTPHETLAAMPDEDLIRRIVQYRAVPGPCSVGTKEVPDDTRLCTYGDVGAFSAKT